MDWEPATRVQKNSAGEYRALIGSEWVPVAKAQKNDAGQFRVMRMEAAPTAATLETTAPDVPAWGRENPTLYGIAGAARETLGPLVEAAGAGVGGAMGARSGPAGALAGSGLGYAGAKELTGKADVALGNAPRVPVTNQLLTALENAGMGAAFEAGGQVLLPIVGNALRLGGKFAGKLMDVGSTQRAAAIAREALGPDLQAGRAAFQSAPAELSAGQVLPDSPVFQALYREASGRDPWFFNRLVASQKQADVNALNAASSNVGGTATTARLSQEAEKRGVNAALEPVKRTELEVANIAGEKLPRLQGEADRMGAAAASKVEDVRRFTAAGERAGANARQQMVEQGLPVAGARYTYQGEFANKAEQVAAQAADASLNFGAARDFAQAAADSLAAHGLKPLQSNSILEKLVEVAKNKEFAGNTDVTRAISKVAQDIQAWTNSGGVIDAFALDAIRKNSVNAVIRDLYPAAESKVQKELAAKVLTQIKPAIVEAIEKAGGTGYGKYLENYTAAMQDIGRKKLGSVAARLYEENPNDFIRLVRGNAPDVVESILGTGRFDINQELPANMLRALDKAATTLERNQLMTEQAKAGAQKYSNVLAENLPAFRIPTLLNRYAMAVNYNISKLEEQVGKSTMRKLTEAAKSGKSMDELLSNLPAAERFQVLKAIQKLDLKMPPGVGGAAAGGYNALFSDNQNALNQ